MGRRKKGRETSMCVASQAPRTGDLAQNPDMCLDWESNQPLVWRLALNLLSHTSQGEMFDLVLSYIYPNVLQQENIVVVGIAMKQS